ncbi:tyrosine-type recombinase/integrase [Cupriavidus metallidurans]|uniref:Integrase/recombinase n=1 Tax=Cupriavidus metallidurans (strain ATCC 43123 / DSM 2839 / NBRC 102507 / CH34) TaxID=266264 RepID=Q58AM9_CUPMC|nr:tyrosine-type recombinase/integrase [Cupriavidus metallidurans]ABF12847.1 Tyrosine-based site-specific recombinase BimA [Cupriavidus metallidurans CH34]QGS31150.1 tyrosine-type recombinase/integrase [Cupriavidus metallidurans]CAI11238.1 putative integrase/recombinase [Cupriavidus metallidurans CH34]
MNPTDWIDTGAVPPRPLPATVDAALAYLSEALGHPVYAHWTLARVKRRYGSLSDAKAAQPTVLKLLLAHDGAVEYWERGRLRTVPADQAPGPAMVLARLLHTHRRRFRLAASSGNAAAVPAASEAAGLVAAPWLAAYSHAEHTWLARAGRFAQLHAATNTLGVANDAQALALFLRDRTGRSPHTLRAYGAELRRLMRWCGVHEVGPLSDLTRQQLLAYRHTLQHGEPGTENASPQLSEATCTRALAVVASLYGYWYDTGYLQANPAAGLSAGSRARAGFAPTRLIPPALLDACDAWLDASAVDASLPALRRRAIWALYRYAGARLAELVWSDEAALPRLEAEVPGHWTLYVCGKGRKVRAIPLPVPCVAVLRAYRHARGLPPEPPAHEALPVIHGHKGEALQSAGLYREVKAIFAAVADGLQARDPAQALLLRAASPHWLRHAYARTLVVDHQVPLPAAQALLGHASVQTTAAYARTDLTQLRAFVDATFADDAP